MNDYVSKIEALQKEIAEQNEFIEALNGERLYIKAELARKERERLRTELGRLVEENARN